MAEERSIDELAPLVAAAPDDGSLAFEYAAALDAADREAEAIPVYRQALACGLAPEVEYRALVQLGSSLRAVGDSDGALTVHRDVAARWPERAANYLFLALALLDAGAPFAAVAEAFAIALRVHDDDIDYYRGALTTYGKQLGETS